MVVKQIGGRHGHDRRPTGTPATSSSTSTDPANPTYITDTDFDEPDPLTGLDPPEGNAHQGEFSHDNQFLLAADEDFAPFRRRPVDDHAGPNGGEYPAAASAAARRTRPAGPGVNGPTFRRLRLRRSAPIPRGRTIRSSTERGGDHRRSRARRTGRSERRRRRRLPRREGRERVDGRLGRGPDRPTATTATTRRRTAARAASRSSIVAVCTTHEALHLMFGQTPGTTIPIRPATTRRSARPARRRGRAEFDGWGYAHLYDAATERGARRLRDPRGARRALRRRLRRPLDPRVRDRPDENLAYSSYYAGGMRVLRFSRADGLEQVGAWIDRGRPNFWGVEQFTTPGRRAPDRRLRSRLRARDPAVHRARARPQPPSCSDTSAITAPGRRSACR